MRTSLDNKCCFLLCRYKLTEIKSKPRTIFTHCFSIIKEEKQPTRKLSTINHSLQQTTTETTHNILISFYRRVFAKSYNSTLKYSKYIFAKKKPVLLASLCAVNYSYIFRTKRESPFLASFPFTKALLLPFAHWKI